MANPNQLTRRVRTGKIGDLPLDILLEIWRLVEDSGAVARRALKRYLMTYKIVRYWVLNPTAWPTRYQFGRFQVLTYWRRIDIRRDLDQNHRGMNKPHLYGPGY